MGLVHGEKTSFFLNPKKPRVTQSRIRNSTKDKKKAIKKLIKNFLTFRKTYFQKILTYPRVKLNLKLISITQVREDQSSEFILFEKRSLSCFKEYAKQ